MLLLEDRLEAGRTHHEAGRRENAALIYEGILDFSPRCVDALKALITIRLELGDLEAAQALAQKALPIAGKSPDILTLCSQMSLQNKQEEQARALVGQALALDPAHADAAILQAQFLIQDNQLPEAEVLLKSALKANPLNTFILRAMSKLYSAYGIVTPALELAQDALQLDPESAELNGLVGEILAGLGDNTKASEYLQKAHLKAPDNPAFMLAFALNLAALGYLSEAHRFSKRLVALCPDLLPAWLCYIRIMIERGQGRAALAEFLPAVKRHSDRIEASLTLALAYRLAGLSDQALQLLEPLIANSARLSEEKFQKLQNLIRDCYLSTGQIDKAVSTFEHISLSDALNLPEELVANELAFSAALKNGNFVLNSGVTNLEVITLFRFIKHMSKGGTATISGSNTLKQLAALFGSFPYLETDISRQQLPLAEDTLSIPASLLLAIPEKIRGSATMSSPYLAVPDDRRTHWRNALAEFPKPWIGLAWDASRPGLLLEDYTQILGELPGTLFSVAWDDTRRQLKSFPELIDTGVHFKDLVDLSCVVSEMDLIIGPDGIPLHVAGALGKAAIVLTSPARPWYWHGEAGKTFWYPSVQVVASQFFGNWEERFPQIAPELMEHITRVLGTPVSAPRIIEETSCM